MTVGILAFQGGVQEHAHVLRLLGHKVKEIRSVSDTDELTHIILPGGESTVIARFLEETGVGERLKEKATSGEIALYGTCAGAILLSKEATGKNAPSTLDLIDITIDRNAYGSQRESFETTLPIKGTKKPTNAVFIRAPKISRVGEGVDILALHGKDPVLVRSQRILAGTFHPELRADPSIHEYFLSL